jgi:hypothetical protein
LAVDIEYALSSSGLITIGVARGWYRSQGHIPTASRVGAAYARYIAPEVALYASPMNPTGATIAIHWRLTAATYLNVTGEYASLSVAGFRAFPELPDGDRTAARLTVGFSVLGGALSPSSRAR